MIETISPNPTETGSPPPELLDLIGDFSRYLIRTDRSAATVRTYQWGLRDFVLFLLTRHIRNLAQLDRATVEAFQDRLIACKLKPKSRSLATTGVAQFLKWAADHDLCDLRKRGWLAPVRVVAGRPKPLPPATLAAVLDHYLEAGPQPDHPDHPDRLLWFRNRALFCYLLATGARVSEVLKVSRVGFERVTVRQKGGTEKVLTVSQHIVAIIQEYLEVRTDGAPFLFVNVLGPTAGHPLSPQGVRDVWQRLGHQLRIPPFTTHQIRHTFATELLERGVDSVTVAELLGHRGMQHIRNYAQVGPVQRGIAERAIDDVMRGDRPLGESAASDPRGMPRTVGQRGRPRFQLSGVP